LKRLTSEQNFDVIIVGTGPAGHEKQKLPGRFGI